MGNSGSGQSFDVDPKVLFTENEIVVLHNMFDDLASEKEHTLSKASFLKLFKLPGILGERLFAVFDAKHENAIHYDEFIRGLAMYLRGTPDQKLKLVFKMYDVDASGSISKDDFSTMLHSLVIAGNPWMESAAENAGVMHRHDVVELINAAARHGADEEKRVVDLSVDRAFNFSGDQSSGKDKESLSLEEFQLWLNNNPSVMETLEKVFVVKCWSDPRTVSERRASTLAPDSHGPVRFRAASVIECNSMDVKLTPFPELSKASSLPQLHSVMDHSSNSSSAVFESGKGKVPDERHSSPPPLHHQRSASSLKRGGSLPTVRQNSVPLKSHRSKKKSHGHGTESLTDHTDSEYDTDDIYSDKGYFSRRGDFVVRQGSYDPSNASASDATDDQTQRVGSAIRFKSKYGRQRAASHNGHKSQKSPAYMLVVHPHQMQVLQQRITEAGMGGPGIVAAPIPVPMTGSLSCQNCFWICQYCPLCGTTLPLSTVDPVSVSAVGRSSSDSGAATNGATNGATAQKTEDQELAELNTVNVPNSSLSSSSQSVFISIDPSPSSPTSPTLSIPSEAIPKHPYETSPTYNHGDYEHFGQKHSSSFIGDSNMTLVVETVTCGGCHVWNSKQHLHFCMQCGGNSSMRITTPALMAAASAAAAAAESSAKMTAQAAALAHGVHPGSKGHSHVHGSLDKKEKEPLRPKSSSNAIPPSTDKKEGKKEAAEVGDSPQFQREANMGAQYLLPPTSAATSRISTEMTPKRMMGIKGQVGRKPPLAAGKGISISAKPPAQLATLAVPSSDGSSASTDLHTPASSPNSSLPPSPVASAKTIVESQTFAQLVEPSVSGKAPAVKPTLSIDTKAESSVEQLTTVTTPKSIKKGASVGNSAAAKDAISSRALSFARTDSYGAMDAHLDFEGWIFQRSGRLIHSMKARYCLVRDGFMYIFKSQDSVQPKNVICLEGCFIEIPDHDDYIKEGYFEFQIVLDHSRHSIFAKTREDRRSWVRNLRRCAHTYAVEEFYDMKKEIGKGKFATVYEAVHKFTGESVAIKVVSKKLIATKQEEQENLRAEIAILKLMHHPHIIRLYEVFESVDVMYIVMPLMSHGDLFDRILTRQVFQEDVARSIIWKMLSAVDYLHERGVVHRDIKPENILCDSEADDTLVYLADFGLSNFCTPHEFMKVNCGTISYVAPEVLSLQGYSKAVDVWGLGVIMFVLLSGELPFQGDTPQEVIQQTLYGSLQLSADEWKHVSSEGKTFVRQLLQKNPKSRITISEAMKHPWFNPLKEKIAAEGEKKRLAEEEAEKERLAEEVRKTELEEAMRLAVEERAGQEQTMTDEEDANDEYYEEGQEADDNEDDEEDGERNDVVDVEEDEASFDDDDDIPVVTVEDSKQIYFGMMKQVQTAAALQDHLRQQSQVQFSATPRTESPPPNVKNSNMSMDDALTGPDRRPESPEIERIQGSSDRNDYHALFAQLPTRKLSKPSSTANTMPSSPEHQNNSRRLVIHPSPTNAADGGLRRSASVDVDLKKLRQSNDNV